MTPKKENNGDDGLVQVNQEIAEIKKKIQLSEGQRKAHFEECDAEKKRNIERIRVLKKEVKEIYYKLAEPSLCDDSVLKVSSRYPKDVGALRSKKLEEAIEFMDLKCIDLNKRLDIIKYWNKMKKTRLKRLAEEYRDFIIATTSKKSGRVEIVSTKPVCVLENQIHRVEMNMMEAEHVNKKYKTIRLYLLSDSVEFESSLKKLEQEIQKQEAEIKHLESINKEALGLRDVTKGTLLRHEISALNAGKSRENQLQDFRQKVEERKLELERLERRIFPAGRVMFDEGAEGGQTAQANESTNQLMCQLEDHFSKLKIATGETDAEEVLSRFLSQKETKKRLDFLKKITEDDKKQLELKKERCLAELEAFKYTEDKDKEESQEELDRIKAAIELQKKLKEEHEKDVERIMDQLICIRKYLYSFINELRHMDDELTPDISDDVNAFMDILNCLSGKIRNGLAKIGFGENLGDTMKNIEVSQYQHYISAVAIPVHEEEPLLFPGLLLQEEGKPQKVQQPSLLVPEVEDEEDVFSRVYLKRQSQLIVDAKSRKKFGRVLNFSRAKK